MRAERSRQRRVGEVLVPGSQHARGQSGVSRVNRHRRPVHVPDDCTSARSKGPVQFGESCIHVRDVLENLHADRAVECRALDRERCGLSFEEPDVVATSAAGARKLKHRGAAVHAHHRAGRTNDLRELKTVEARPAPSVEDSLTEDCPECLANQLAAMHSIVNPVEGLDPPGGIGIELQLAHRPSSPACLPRRAYAISSIPHAIPRNLPVLPWASALWGLVASLAVESVYPSPSRARARGVGLS